MHQIEGNEIMNFAAMQDRLRDRFAKWFPFGINSVVEDDGFVTVYSSRPVADPILPE